MSSTRLSRTVVVAVLAVTAAAGITATATASPAPVADPNASVAYQHDPAHDGNSADPSFVAPFTERWSTTLASTVGFPVVANGIVYVNVAHPTGGGVDVEALSLSSGAVLWGPTDIGGTYAGYIAYDSGQLFALNDAGSLIAFDATTGAVNWATQLQGQFSFTAPPAAVNGTVYAAGAGFGGTLYAVDEATGATKWTDPVENGDGSSPAVDDSGVFAAYACEQAYKFDFSGNLVWHHDTGCEGGGGRTPVLYNSRLYVRDNAGMAPAVLDAATGAQLSSFASGPVPAFDGRHRVTLSQGVITVSDLTSGVSLWHADHGEAVTAPLVANGYVIEGLSDGTIEARRIQDGQLAWQGRAEAKLVGPDERNGGILTGLAQGDGMLVVPAGRTLTVFQPVGDASVTLEDGPDPNTVVGSAVSFSFTSPVTNAQYACTLDGQTSPCTSPLLLKGLSGGVHRFSVSVAYAPLGAAERMFTVDSVAPAVTVHPFSSAAVSAGPLAVDWTGSDEGSGVADYQVRVRRTGGAMSAAWAIHAPTTATSASYRLSPGVRLCVSVRARDRVGNWSLWTPKECVVRR